MSHSASLSSFAALSLALVSHLALGTPAAAEQTGKDDQVDRPKQIVMVSFDGAGDNLLWEKSRAIAARSGAHFTYFLSCTNLIDRAARDSYKAPDRKAGRSNVGFAPTAADAAARLDQIWKAHQEGHEIASHACGHFDGAEWTSADWRQEFESFNRVLLDAWQANGVGDRKPEGWETFVTSGITGFRAPYLSQSDALTTAAREAGFAYDASLVTRGPLLPDMDDKLARFGLPLIPEGPQNRRIIAMDYNLFVRHSGGIDNPSNASTFEERAYAAFKAAFDAQYQGDRIPLQIGLHFVEMNAGAYWKAMERLVDDVCRKPDVACLTYAETLNRLRGDDQPKQSSGL